MAIIIFLDGNSLKYEKMRTTTPTVVTVTDAMGIDYSVMIAGIQYMSLPAGYLKEEMSKARMKYE